MTLDPRITFTRASLGTYYGSDGLLKYAAHNLIFPSEDFSSANWTKGSGGTITADNIIAPNGTLTADRLNHVTAGSVVGANLSRAHFAPQPFMTSVYAKAGTKNWLAIVSAVNSANPTVFHCFFNLATGTAGSVGTDWASSGIQNVGNGWYRCWAVGKATTQGAIMAFYVAETNTTVVCTSPGDIYLWGAQIEQFTTETAPRTYLPTTTAIVHGPRFDYDPVTHAARGLLIEGAMPVGNSLTNSQDFTAASYTKAGATVTADQIVSPDGTTTADLITASASPSTLTTNFAVSDGQVYAISVYAKKGTSDWFYLCALTTGTTPDAPTAYFNLATGAIGTVDAAITNSGIQNIGNGWYRCWIARPAPTGGNERWNAGLCDANGSTTVTIGKTVYFWGGQFENQGTGASGVPTSYVPTVGSTVTRAADVAVMTGTNFSSWYNASAGTFVAEFDAFAVSASLVQTVFAADNAATGQQLKIILSGLDPTVSITTGGTNQATIDLGTVAANTISKAGVSYALNDIAGCFNGGTVGTDTTATMPTPTQLRFGVDAVASRLNGHIRRIRFWNVAKSDAELQALTT